MSLEKKEPQEKLPLWFREKRLPTDEEVKANKGFPSKEEESLLREKFVENFREKVANFLKQKIQEDDEFIESLRKVKRGTVEPSRKFSENEVEQVLHYLYGIYFYNLVSGGTIISENLGSNATFKSFKKSIFSTDESGSIIETKIPFSVNNLNDWPILLTNSVLNPAMAAASIPFNTAYIYEDQLHNIDPRKEKKMVKKPGKTILNLGEISYKSNTNNEWILTGLEEAQHLHFFFLREKRESEIQQKLQGKVKNIFVGSGKRIETGPLESFTKREQFNEENRKNNPNFIIDYNSLLGQEFAAHIVQARYVEKYLPQVWESGYKDYDLAVRENRKKAKKNNVSKN